ncbi:MAG: TIGR00266 family protein [Candidatus Caenarcaniphilales bacterium]|nr:TIGR00266 family protein [Candidatus Caenarcaniphilales bacterium]
MNIPKHRIIGDDLQAAIFTLEPGQSLVSEPGSMMFMNEGIELETKLDDKENSGLMDKLFTAGKRLISGESLFITIFENKSNKVCELAFAAPYPGKIIPINLTDFGGEIICQRDSFLCASRGTDISIAFTKRIGAGFFGGEGFVMQSIKGNGQAFLHAGGTIHEIELKTGEILKVDTGCIVAFQPGIDYDIEVVKGVKNLLFGGEGFFFAVLKGPGKVYLQTLPFSRLANRIIASAPRSGGSAVEQGGLLSGGQGGLLGGLGGLIEGD